MDAAGYTGGGYTRKTIPSKVQPSERLQALRTSLEGLVSGEPDFEVRLGTALCDVTGHGGCYSAPILQLGTAVRSGWKRLIPLRRMNVAFELSPGYSMGEETGHLEIAGQSPAGISVLTIPDIVSAAVSAGYEVVTQQGAVLYQQKI